MSKHNLFTKKLKKQFVSFNDSIEGYFNKIKFFKQNFKKTEIYKNNKVSIGFGLIILLSLIYLLLPTFYDKSIIQKNIKDQIYKKYNISLKFNEDINYSFLPKPYFTVKNASILNGKKEIASVEKLNIHIKKNQFYKFNSVEVKDLVFKKADFYIYQNDVHFFKRLLETEPNENQIIIKKSNIFFKDENDEVLFINKIYQSKFYYDSINLQNTLTSKNEIFNIPYKITIQNNKFNKNIFTKFNSKKIRLNIENEIDYNENIKKGLLDILFVNKSTSLNYKVDQKSLSFSSVDRKKTYSGSIDFKPFYFFSNFNYDGLSFRNLFDENTIFIDLVRSELLNNKNLNANIDFKVKDITNIDELNNLFLKIAIEQGDIKFSNSNIMWKEDIKIFLEDTLLNFENNEINLNGKILINFIEYDNFYKSFQVKKNNRKKIEKINLDFNYNINKQKVTLSNVQIDNVSDIKLESFIENYNENENKIFNKIRFKNFVNELFSVYAG